MPKKFISLREVARQLDIPPSTVVYYKDRFAGYIPSQGGEGRRKRYPLEVVDIFRSIREMFGNNWSTEQIEEELSTMNATTSAGKHSEESVFGREPHWAGGASQDAAAVLDKVTDLLENQSLFKSEVRTLRDEIAALRQERKQEQARYEEVLASMGRELGELRRTTVDLENLFSRDGNTDKMAAPPQFPDENYLARPLVIRTQQSEYLGVLGKVRKHFALRDFVFLVETNVNGRTVELSWEKQADLWSLSVSLVGGDLEQHFVLVTQETVTPSKNVVTEIVRLNVNGADVPDSLLLSLFKKIKDTFDRQSQ